jgi:integrase/recombinase XerD
MNDPVLKRMQEELGIRGRSPRTSEAYLGVLRRFLIHYAGLLEDLDVADARAHLVYLKGQGRSASTINQAQGAFKFLFTHVLRRPQDMERLPIHKRPKKLPRVLARSQVRDLIRTIKHPKYRTFTMLLYSSGLRLNEALQLKPSDIDSPRMRILVREGKGSKDREVPLAHTLLDQLRNYWCIKRPKQWLFPGTDPAKHMHKGTIQRVIREAGREAGIHKGVSPHVLRHSFATHLLESGTPLPYIQKMLGHGSITTTMVYLKVTAEGLDKIVSPLDQLGL